MANCSYFTLVIGVINPVITGRVPAHLVVTGPIFLQHIGRRFFLSKSRQVWAMINIQSQKPRVEFGRCKVARVQKRSKTWKRNTVVAMG